MRILITGATGFIGKNLCTSLFKKNYKILGISRSKIKSKKNITFIKSSLKLNKKNFNIIEKFKPNILINLAWEGIPNYSNKFSKKNLNDQVIFFEKIKNIKSLKKIFSVGSCWEYQKKKGKLNENCRLNYKTEFTNSKIKILNFLTKNCKKLGIKFFYFRLFYVFGKYQNNHSLIPHIITSIKNRQKFKIRNIKNQNDFVHIDDVCRIFNIAILGKIKEGIYNIGSGKLTSILYIINYILKFYKQNKILAKGNLNDSFYSDNTKLKKNFKSFKFQKIEYSLKKTLLFYEKKKN
mgnify:CR=1 FL=1